MERPPDADPPASQPLPPPRLGCPHARVRMYQAPEGPVWGSGPGSWALVPTSLTSPMKGWAVSGTVGRCCRAWAWAQVGLALTLPLALGAHSGLGDVQQRQRWPAWRPLPRAWASPSCHSHGRCRPRSWSQTGLEGSGRGSVMQPRGGCAAVLPLPGPCCPCSHPGLGLPDLATRANNFF